MFDASTLGNPGVDPFLSFPLTDSAFWLILAPSGSRAKPIMVQNPVLRLLNLKQAVHTIDRGRVSLCGESL